MHSKATVGVVDLGYILDLQDVAVEIGNRAARLDLDYSQEWPIDNRKARGLLRQVAQLMFDWSGVKVILSNGDFELDLTEVSKADATEADKYREDDMQLGDLRWLAQIGPKFGFATAAETLMVHLEAAIKAEVGFSPRWREVAAEWMHQVSWLLLGV